MVMVRDDECDVDKVTELVESFIPSAVLKSNVGAELTYILPQVRSHKVYIYIAYSWHFTFIVFTLSFLKIVSFIFVIQCFTSLSATNITMCVWLLNYYFL